MTIVIKNWDKHFESSETRKLKTLLWVKIKNRQDSLAFRTIAKMSDGSEVFTAWILMVQVASKQTQRGVIPYAPEELEIMTGFPAKIFKKAFAVLQMPKIDWISQSPSASGNNPSASGLNPSTPPVEEGRKEGTLTQNGLEAKFEKLWNFYDKKVDRERCWKSFKKLTASELVALSKGLAAYIAATPDKKYRKNPLTYLNGKCWLDEVITEKEVQYDLA